MKTSGRWRTVLLSSGAALGAAATFNALTNRNVPPLENDIGGEEIELSWRGYAIAATRRGDGPPVVLLHGIHSGASSYEWRLVVDELAGAHTVYTIDLLGFGRSERPDIRYTARVYTSLIGDAVEMLVGGPSVLIGSGLTAAYVAVLGARDPARFPAVVLIEPTGLARLNDAPGAAGEFAKFAFDSPVVGTALFNALVSKPGIRYWLQRVYHNQAMVTDALVEHYFQTSHQPGAKYAPTALLSGHLNLDVRRAMRRLMQPALLVWGDRAVETPIEDAPAFQAMKRDMELVVIPETGMLPHDERPDLFAGHVTRFVRDSWTS